ncbi:MAG: hypothetical protein R3A79_13995 [Nannocystaceae bacterium]
MSVASHLQGGERPRRAPALACAAGLALLLPLACADPPATPEGTSSTTSTTSTSTAADTTAVDTTAADTTTGGDDPGALIVHSFGDFELQPYQERFRCVTWTIGNEEALYVNTVHLSNDGGYHHSNWFIVPDDLFEGPDGFFKCSDRGYTETIGAISGSVLFAQSTQSRYETQALPEGVVVKVPPRHKVISEIHFLNPSSAPLTTELRMGFDLLHPADVDVVVSPFRMNIVDLEIPALKRSRNQTECLFGDKYESFTGHPFDLKLYYVLPHFHYLGESFFVDVVGGPRDGERIFELSGFNGDGNGQAYDPPLDMTGASGFRFGCGYNNWTNSDVHYGVGDQEMCTMLGLADAHALLDGGVSGGTKAVDVDGETVVMEGPCGVITVPKTAAYSMPKAEEVAGELYLPPPGPGDSDLPPVKPCVDADAGATPTVDATLSDLRWALFEPSCSFNACHATGPSGAAGGLDLRGAGLHAALLGHEVQANAGMPLITPGDPSQSWLFRLVSECAPTDAGGGVVAHMPLNAPTLASDGLVAALRQWIVDGALDN